MVGSHVGLGTRDHLSALTEGYPYMMLLMRQSKQQNQLLGTIEGLHVGAIAAIPFVN